MVLVYYHIPWDKSLKYDVNHNQMTGSPNQSVIMYKKYQGNPSQNINACNAYSYIIELWMLWVILFWFVLFNNGSDNKQVLMIYILI